MHFLNVVQNYWHNPDLNSIQVFGKDIRALLVVSCQKIFFEPGHTYYHYGPVLKGGFSSGASSSSFSSTYSTCDMDLSVSNHTKELPASVSKDR